MPELGKVLLVLVEHENMGDRKDESRGRSNKGFLPQALASVMQQYRSWVQSQSTCLCALQDKVSHVAID